MTGTISGIWIDEADTICRWPPPSFKMGQGLTIEKLIRAKSALDQAGAARATTEYFGLPMTDQDFQYLYQDHPLTATWDWLASRYWGPPLRASPAPSVACATANPSHGGFSGLAPSR